MNRLDRDQLLELFPLTNYRHRMHLRAGSIAGFFGPSDQRDSTLAQRRHWLAENRSAYAAATDSALPLLDEMVEVLDHHQVFDREHVAWPSDDFVERAATLGQQLEPDYMLLAPQPEGPYQLVAGCICFPSSWSLEEKIGRPLDWIHQVVPELNAQLGRSIDVFLERLKPGTAWLRSNWGLSRSSEWNQHPLRRLLRLDATVELEEVWLRVERQALVRLPQTQGVLFGIEISNYGLGELALDSELCKRFCLALESMPESMAIYKNIATSRSRLLSLLR